MILACNTAKIEVQGIVLDLRLFSLSLLLDRVVSLSSTL
jgi:hypothetical protein